MEGESAALVGTSRSKSLTESEQKSITVGAELAAAGTMRNARADSGKTEKRMLRQICKLLPDFQTLLSLSSG